MDQQGHNMEECKEKFLANDILGAEQIASQIYDWYKSEKIGDYLIRAKFGFLCCLFIEEYRRLKQHDRFEYWQLAYRNLKLFGDCGTAQGDRIRRVFIFMRERFERIGNKRLMLKYDRFSSSNNLCAKRYRRRFFKI